MDLYSITSSGLGEKLKCFLCKNYLSCFPISLCSNNQNICGRCTAPEDVHTYQNETYETVCQFLRFPCRYELQGCPEELLPKEMPQHEETCRCRTVACLIQTPNSCMWMGRLPDLLLHCKNQHSDLIIQNGSLEMTVLSSHEQEYLIESKGNLLIFSNKFDCQSKVWQCAIYGHQYESSHESRPCRLRVQVGKTTMTHDFNTTSFMEKVFTKISLHFVAYEHDSNEIIVSNISVGNESVNKDDMNILKAEELYSKILPFLECNLCHQVAYPQAYRTVSKMNLLDTICAACYSNRKKQTVVIISPIPDSFLNTLMDLKIFSCRYKSNGCKFISHKSFLDVHEYKLCEYTMKKCPVFGVDDCIWRGPNNDLVSHILDKHENILIKSGEELCLNIKDIGTDHRLIKFSKYLFRLSYCSTENDFFKWSVQAINERPDIMYNLDVIDSTNRGQRLLMGKYCSSLTDQSEIFNSDSQSCCLHLDHFRPFTCNKGATIKFAVRIFDGQKMLK